MNFEDKETIDSIIKLFWQVEKEHGNSAIFYGKTIDYYTIYFGKYYILLESFSKTLHMDVEKVKVYKIKLDEEAFDKIVNDIIYKFNNIKKSEKERKKLRKVEELEKTFRKL